MSQSPSHIIQRQCIELQMPTRLPHLEIQDEAIALFKDVLRDRIGECLDRLFPGEELVQLDSIVIDLGRIPAAGWEEEFVARFVEEFEMVLESAQKAHATEAAARGLASRPSAQADDSGGERGPWAALSYFLTYGFLPWWHLAHDKSSIQDLVRALLAQGENLTPGLVQRMQAAFAEPMALERLVHALPDALLSALAGAMGRLSPQADAAMGALTRLLTLPAHGISRSAARVAVWQEILGGAPAPEPLLPEDVLAAAIVQLAASTEQAPEALLQIVASDDPQLSGAWLRDLAHVQARLSAHPAQARAHSPALRRAAEALHTWLQQADAQLFDVDKALSLLRDLQAALSPGELRDALAQVIEQLNAARRQRPAAPLQVPAVPVLQRLAHAMREEASLCPAPLLLAIQDFYLRISLLQAPDMQDTLLAAPLQHLAMEIMRLRASAGTSSQGPYLQAAARQLLDVLDARAASLLGDFHASAPSEAALPSEAVGHALAVNPIASKAVLPAPSVPQTQAHASAWIAVQVAALVRTELAAPAAIDLATWRTWFKALRSPAFRPLLTHSTWRDLLQAISELLSGQSPALQLRSILQLAETLLAAGPTPHIPTSTPGILRAALEELAQIGDAAGTPKEVAQVQARLRAIASVLHDHAAAQGDSAASDAATPVTWKAAWLPLKASLHALATFGRPALVAAGVSAAQVDGLLVLLEQAHAEGAEGQMAGILGRLLDIGARVQAAQEEAVRIATTLEKGPQNTGGLAAGLVPQVPERGVYPSSTTDFPPTDRLGGQNPPSVQQEAVSASISPAVQQRLTRFLNALIALTASLELELRQQAPPVKPHVRKQEWRKEWEALREWMDMGENDVRAAEWLPDAEGIELEAITPLGDAGLSHEGLQDWKAPAPIAGMDIEGDSLDASSIAGIVDLGAMRQSRVDVLSLEPAEAREASQVETSELVDVESVWGDPAISKSRPANDSPEINTVETIWSVGHWQSGVLEFELAVQRQVEESQAMQVASPDSNRGSGTRRNPGSFRRLPTASETGPIRRKSTANGMLSAPHHAIQSAEVLVGLAELLAPAIQEEQMTDEQLRFWQEAPIQVLAAIVEALRTGKLLRGELVALEKLLHVAEDAAFDQLDDVLNTKSGDAGSVPNHLDPESGQQRRDLDTAEHAKGIDLEAMESSSVQTENASFEDLEHKHQGDPSKLDTHFNANLSALESTEIDIQAHYSQPYFAAPVFRCLIVGQALEPAEKLKQDDPTAREAAATSTTAPEAAAIVESAAAHREYLTRIAQRQLLPLARTLPSEIREAALEAQADHVLHLLGELVSRMQAQGADQAGHPSLSPSTFGQVRLWTQQFPGQPLPKSLAQGLADALAVLRATASPNAAALQSPTQAPAIPPADGEHERPATAQNQKLAGTQVPSLNPAAPSTAIIAAALPPPLPLWRAQIESLAETSPAHRLLAPRPVTILPQRRFLTCRAQLLAAVQGMMQTSAPRQGLRRTLDPLTRQHKPAPTAPSLSDASRQQLAQAAQQAKALLREPLPARLHAALRSLQSGLTGHSQGRPDLKAIQRISNQANSLLQGGKGKSAPKEPEKELSIYVKNAGLVLLWPFIQRFFQNLGIVEGREFLSPEAHGRAVLFLQYLADPDPETAEHLLPLCKLLCAYPDDRPIALELAPTEEEIEQCEGLLATVPSHHPAMKNMRVDGFRTAWLQREGALKPRGDHYLLHVEKQAYDVLLEQLPWSIRVIRLPWMHTAILTEW